MLKVGQVILLLQVFFLNVHFINSAATISTESTGTNKYMQFSQLIKTFRANDLKKLKELVQAGANVNELGPGKVSLLMEAAIVRADTSILKYLIENNAEINVGDSHGFTPLHFAVGSDVSQNVKLLLEAGADLNKVTYGSLLTPLDLARERFRIIETLIDAAKTSREPQLIKYRTGQGASIEQIIKLLENEEERRKKLIQQYNDEILKQMSESDYASKAIPPLVKLSAHYLLADKYEDIPLSYRLAS